MAFISMFFAFFIVIALGLLVIISIASLITGLILLLIYFIKRQRLSSRGLLYASLAAIAFGLTIILILFALTFLKGFGPVADIPEVIEVDGAAYKTGFYGDLFINDVARYGEPYYIDGVQVYRIAHGSFDMVYYDDGPEYGGAVYCNEAQWQEAKAFYDSADSYIIKCIKGNGYYNTGGAVIDGFDYDIFQRLYEFSKNDDNKQYRQSDVETREISNESFVPSVIIYKESTDGLFISDMQYEYKIIEKELYLLVGISGDNTESYVKVPDHIGDYVVQMIG